ncbi:hemagglutinin repeat-containing protein [Pseudomonas chlororaphis]|uniref:two-partner secretion domain-containing protein n=6 Tax=Pseudomonas chlororaphis TaxID=587753 RepID=UPI000A54B9C1|nr:hemagglutinin repeat-containing protein [Pseudomonas chlororaphis]AZD00799.1 Putative large exoprotein, ShlA/HecA/FhaA family [Pseudomonas chlororaphis subsp. chlororaphis]WDG99192.1 hemagglutinin repeat-containing protein [Pseudomonas chlororaphis]WDH18199.1 hemagglutinin repeat-containing protein [Pseudomonas chlororaphis]WDH67060.1 hemagglutinin repeat-containing protein [Pseudomonas chlororaphis]SMQ05287.1 filamentous hemagglutinin [Pseudomonas chlororaphis]
MDVRQFAFLARQPSAALKTREHFCGLPKRGLAFILANAMFWQPLWAQAEGIVVSAPGTSLGQAGNGVPIVNIATPNGSGLSHNQFHDYNVGQQGVILNNATDRTQSTQLGGIIVGNPNLKGVAAQTILNEVNGGSPSQLRGYTEVAGQSAHVIVANPYGISCNGCGFINTPKATLTTGKPVIENGQLTRYQVDQGQVTIDGAQLNASNVDRFEIITRSARINAEIQANNLTIVTGRNDVDARTLNATARADDGSTKPELAIDSSALGGMYAGAIRLVGTEAGVGVKLDGKLIASGGDIQLDANGQLRMVDASAANGAVKVKAASLDAQGSVHAGSALTVQTQGDLNNRQNLTARDSITLSAGGQLSNNGIIEAGVNADNSRNANGDVSLSAQSLNNSGKSVIASRNLTVNAVQSLNNQGGTLSAGQSANVSAATLDNQNKGRVLSSGSLELTAGQVLNGRGLISGDGNLSATLGHLNNHDGEVSSAGITTLTANSLYNSGGQVTGDVALNIGLIGALNNQGGVLGSAKRVSISAASLDNSHAGSLASDGSLTTRIVGLFDNQSAGDLGAKGVVDLQAGSLDNRGGSLTGKDRLSLDTALLDNRAGKVRTDKHLQLDVRQLDNRDKGVITSQAGIGLTGTRLDNRGGLLSAVGPVTLKAQNVQNALGRIASQGDVHATVDTFQQQGGTLVAQGNLTLIGSVLDNRDNSLVAATKALKLEVQGIDNRAGKLSSGITTEVDGQQLDNSDGGRVLAGSDLELKVGRLINQSKGLIQGKGTTTLNSQSLDNTDGEIDSHNGLEITLAGGLDNTRGLVRSDRPLTLGTSKLTNTAGRIESVEDLSITSRGELLNQGGSIKSEKGLTVASGPLDNSQKGLLSGKHATQITATTFNNSQGGSLRSESSLGLIATQVNNAGGSISSAQDLTASVTGLDQQHGELFSEAALSLDLNNGQLNNQGGYIHAPGVLLLKNLKGVDNRKGEISSARAFSLEAQSLDNNGAKLISDQGLTLRIAEALNNVKGLVSASSLDSHSASLDNTDGVLGTTGDLDLKVDTVFANQRGTVVADGALLLTAASLDNRAADISGKQDVTARIGTLDNQGGKLIATGVLDLTGASLDNRQGGLVGATKALKLKVDTLDNRSGELSTQAGLSLTGKHLDNSDQGLVEAHDTLTLKVDEVINQAVGLINALADLTITGGRIDNRSGKIKSQQGLDLTLKGNLQNNQGLIDSQSTLDVAAAALDNSDGRLMSAAALDLGARGALTNVGGKLVSEGGVQLRSASLDNSHKGVISGKGAVQVTTGDFDNSQAGSLDSGDTLDLTAAKLTNAAGRIGSDKALTAKVSSLEQQGGSLFSNTSLSLDLNHGRLNNRDGFIHAPGALLLKNLSDLDNRNGEISSDAAYELNAKSLNNDGGQLLGNQALTLRIEQALSSIKGKIGAAALEVEAASLDNSAGALTSRSGLKLTVQGPLTNQDQGLINAINGLSIASGDLNNRHGSVLAGDWLNLSAKALNNTDSGLINSKGALELTAHQLDSSDAGEVSAKADMNLKVMGLTQRGGRLLGDGAVTLDLANGDLDNSLGRLNAKGLLSIKQLQDLKNQQGTLSSRQGFTLTGRTLDNSQGKLISEAALGVVSGQLLNANGLVSGIKGLTVEAGSLDNRNHGTLSSKEGNLAVDVSGALLNSGAGALASNGTLKLSAASLDNSGEGVVSSVGGQTLTVAGLLNNAGGGLLDSGATLDLKAATLNNQAGNLSALQSVDLRAGSLDNSGGSLATKGALTLDVAGHLDNVLGTLSSDGALLLKRATHVDNRGGKLIGQDLLTFNADSLDNRDHGTVAANRQAILTVAGAVQNAQGGLIYSRDAGLELKAASLDNSKAAVQSQNGLTLNISGDFNNQGGKVIGQDGAVSITAANLDNRGGVLSSLKGALETHISGVLLNGYDLNDQRQRGVIEAQRLNLRALAGLNNNGGRIAARQGDVIVNTAGFDNRNGGLYASGQLGVTATTFDNGGDKGGQVAGQGIDLGLSGALNNRLGVIESDTSLLIRAASIDNAQGQLRAAGSGGKSLFQISGLLDNRNGRIEVASTDLGLGATSLQNAGGTLLHSGKGQFDISMANVSGAGGTLVTQGGLTLNADSWSNTSVIQAGRLKVNVNNFYQSAGGQLLASNSFDGGGGNWNNDGLIASDGSLSLQLSGAYGGNGRLTSLGDMSFGAAQLDLPGAATITGGGNTRINVGGVLTNRGRLSSAQGLTVNAGTINNYGSLGSAGALTLNAGTLLNSGVSDAEHSSIFSGGDMQLLGNTFSNRYADVFSMGSLLVAANAGQAQSSLLENRSGTIESLGDMTIRAMTVKNVMDILTYSEHEKYYAAITELPCGPFGVCHVKKHGNRRNAVWQLTERDRLQVTASTAASSISSGGQLDIGAQELSNESSFIASSGNLAINAVSIKNQGVVPQDIETTTIKYNHVDEYQGAVAAVAAFNARNGTKPSATFEADLARFNALMTGTRKLAGGGTKALASSDGKRFDAIIQSGASVQLNASEKIDNGVVRGYYAYVGGGKKTGDTSTGSQYSTPIYINSQLPPDLAKQQVNPLALPGFTLPVGQHGLFRLSSEGAGDTAATQRNPAPMDWSMGSISLRFAEREQNLAQSQARALQVDALVPVAATERKLAQVGAVQPGVDASLPMISVTTPTDSGTATQGPVYSRTPAQQVQGSIVRVQGIPTLDNPPQAHKYLVETNPVLTNQKQFMSSDYLLSNLGYNPDNSWKRLGDGFYEQRLIQQAVVARTGQRFIDGQDSDEKLFKYLMDNALQSKQQLNLAIGTSLTSEQVAALTHDIVWLESHPVNGENVLVPVLYMAHANNRLAANGALIAGQDISLIAGKDLLNAGTLRATNNLSAKAGNDLVNSGLIEAGNRLDLLAGNNLVNKAGGIIAGRDVNLSALNGDLINERTVTRHQNSGGDLQQRRDFLDSAARIEAANDLTLKAGRDFNNAGGVLQAARDTTINAGRDANLTAVEQQDNETRTNSLHTSTSQHGSVLTSGRDLTINSGRDLSAIASQIDAKRNLALAATGNLTLASAADEQHSYSSSKKYKGQSDKVSQVATAVTAGGSVALSAGKDLELIASRVSAGDEAYLVAGGNLALESAEDSNYSFYSKTKKSSSGKKSRLDEVASTTNIASSVTSGTDSVLVAGNDLLIKGSDVTAEKGAAKLMAGNDVQILAVSDSNSARHESSKSKSSWGGLKSSKVKDQVAETQTTAVGSVISGNTVEVAAKRDATVTGSALVSTQDLAVQAGRDLTIDAAENTFTRSELHKQKNRDLTGVLTANNLGVDDITGNQHLSIRSGNHTGKAAQTTLTGSTVGSSEGSVRLEAGRELKVVASDLVSTKEMNLTGSNVTIAAGAETATQSSTDSSKSLAVGRVVGGMVVDTYKSIRNDVRAARDADDSRLKAVKGAQALLSAYNAADSFSADAANQSQGKPANSSGSLIKIGTELGSTRSKSTSEYRSETAKQSSLTSGAGLVISAVGDAAGTQGDIHVVGSSLKAKDTLLMAKNDITLESAQDRAQWDNQSRNSKTSIGASFNIGDQNGFTLDLGAQMAKGMGKGHSVTQVNSTVDTGLLMLKSGQDTTLAGAQVRADTIKADVGGNLNIVSRQDEADQKNRQTSGGFGASICVPPFCYGSIVTASGNIAGSKMNSDYQAVTDQTGLYAGKGGYDIYVGANTQLQGGVIASEASADKNHLDTGRLIVSDIKNSSEIKSQSASLSASYTSTKWDKPGGPQTPDSERKWAHSETGGTLPLALKESDHSSTRSAISEGTITVRDPAGAQDLVGLNRDTSNANQHLDRPDEKKMQERMDLIQSSAQLASTTINLIAKAKADSAKELLSKAKTSEEKEKANTALADAASWSVGGDKRIMADIASGLIAAGLGGVGGTTAVGIVANTTANDTFKKIGDYADAQKRNATEDISRAAWAEGGAARVLLHALAGAAMGLSSGSVQSGALGAGASAALMPAIAEALGKSGIEQSNQEAIATLIATGLGASAGSLGGTAGAIAGGGSGAGVEVNNRQHHRDQELPLLKKKAEELEQTLGKPKSDALWEDLLLLASGEKIDAVEKARLEALVEKWGSDPTTDWFKRDLDVAKNAVKQLVDQKIPLTWADGKPIIAYGNPVYAFASTPEQFNDSGLFNGLGKGYYGELTAAEKWKQYGKAQAEAYSKEILDFSSNNLASKNATDRILTLAVKNTESVSIIDDVILSLGGVVGGKATLKTILEAVAERRAAKKVAAAEAESLGAKGTGGVISELEREIPATSAIAREGLRNNLAAQVGIPRNIAEAPTSVWGKSIDDLKQSFLLDRFIVTSSTKSGTSGNAQVFKVSSSDGGVSKIVEVQYSPSTAGAVKQSTHIGEYYKLTYADGSKIKIVEPATYRPTFERGQPVYDKNTVYLNPQGQNVKFDASQNLWTPQ